MDPGQKLKLLKSLRLLDQIPDEQLKALGEYLKPLSLAAEAVVFEEGSQGRSLYFVSSGQVRISKRVRQGVSKDLAILGPGDCFGEMALIEPVKRSATAATVEAAVLFELDREDLERWLKARPELAMEFFADLVQVQSRRLRTTSSELTLLYDLSALLLEPRITSKEFLARSLECILPHLDGAWSASGFLYNRFNDEMEFVAALGEAELERDPAKLPAPGPGKNAWSDETTFLVFLPEAAPPLLGRAAFKSAAPIGAEARAEIGRTLTTVARLVTSAVQNIDFRTEESLRARLKSAQAHAGL